MQYILYYNYKTYLLSLKQVLAMGNLAHKKRDCPSLGCRALIPIFNHTSHLVMNVILVLQLLPHFCYMKMSFYQTFGH